MSDEWNYECRSTCQEIIPNLWLGPHTVGRNLDFLQSLHVQCIVLVKDDNPAENASLRERFPHAFEYLAVLMTDSPTVSCMHAFSSASGRLLDGGVLVLGSAGMNRSAAFVAALLIKHNHLSAEEALDLITSRRCCVIVSASLRAQLSEFHLLQTRNAVEPTRSARKRREGES